MILGVGADLVDVERLRAVLDRHGARFLARVFTATEQAGAATKADPAAFLAKRFAAKEAAAKALGTGIASGVSLTDIGVVDLGAGRPGLVFTGGAAARLAALAPPGHRGAAHLSLSDEPPHALAFVVLSAVPDDGTLATAGRSGLTDAHS